MRAAMSSSVASVTGWPIRSAQIGASSAAATAVAPSSTMPRRTKLGPVAAVGAMGPGGSGRPAASPGAPARWSAPGSRGR